MFKPVIVILWEHEIIKAAQLLSKLRSKDCKPEDAEAALKASFAALYSEELASGECPITVMSCRETVMVTKSEVKA